MQTVTSIPLDYYLILSAVLFTIGATGVLIKRNPIQIFMCVELMLNAVNLTFIAFSRYHNDLSGQLMVFSFSPLRRRKSRSDWGSSSPSSGRAHNINIDDMDQMRG